MGSNIKRVLWISDYFPRPHNMTLGVWALESIYAIQRKGIEIAVLSPTPWIPKLFAFTNNLKNWNKVPFKFNIDSLNIFYPKCPHYPHRTVAKYLYNHIPYFESSFLIKWVKPSIELIAKKFPFQAVHTNFAFPSGYIGFEIKKKFKVPFIVHERSVNRLLHATSSSLKYKLYNKILNEADAVITPNRMMAERIEKFLFNGKKVNVIRDPGNSALIKNITSFSRTKPEQYKNKKIILSVGSLIERKGHEFLIKAINLIKDEFQNIKCLIIGSGIRKNFLEHLIKQLQLNQYVELLGQLPHSEVLRKMSWCDIFVLPSWNEAFGTVYSEAMTFGKPIIACKDEGISEIIEDGVHGLLVNKKDEQSIAEAIKMLLRDEKFAVTIGSSSKILAENELNYDFVSDKLIELYNKINQNEPKYVKNLRSILK